MVEEIPVEQTLEIPEQEATPPPTPPPPTPEAPKRKPGRPRKEAPPPTPEPPAPKPRAKRAARPPPEAAPPVEPQQDFSIGNMSSAYLVAELMNRRRDRDRDMKASLYKSFVM